MTAPSHVEVLEELAKRMRRHIGTPELIPYADELEAAIALMRAPVGDVPIAGLSSVIDECLTIDNQCHRLRYDRQVRLRLDLLDRIVFLVKSDSTRFKKLAEGQKP